MNKVFRTAARMAAPQFAAAGRVASKRGVKQAARWARGRINPGSVAVRNTSTLVFIARGIGIALLVLPIGFLLGRKLLDHRK